MTPERWQAIGDLFEKALERPTEEREAWLATQCPNEPTVLEEARSLLVSHEASAGGFVQEQIRDAVVAFHHQVSAQRRIGPYLLVRELGRGGMGAVYLAERDDEEYQSKVAIKLVRPGMDTEFLLTRFRRERQTLARLRHPNIARLLDGGATEDGLPYIVMEYIDGVWITEYARLSNLTIDQRIELMLPVCAAADYAHRNFVVHRDIKPGNILVDAEGCPKLLDFGICKLLVPDPTATSEFAVAPLTPDYASPEQVRGEAVTVASDVFSLGAVLYELLTGQRPHRIDTYTPLGIERAICDEEVRAPSKVVYDPAKCRKLKGDLDNILLRTLSKDPVRRYESAAQLADDLQRYLNHEPVRARPDTLGYRTMKFIRRNRASVAATVAVAAALLTGAVVSWREARIASHRLDQVRTLANKFVFDVDDAVRPLPGSTRARQLIVQTGLQYLDALSPDASGDPVFEQELAAAYRRIGEVQGDVVSANLGATKEALASYSKAETLLDDAARRRPGDVKIAIERMTLLRRRGDIALHQRDINQAVQLFERAKQIAAPLLAAGENGPVKREAAALAVECSDALRYKSDYDGALREGRESVRLWDDLRAADGGSPGTLRGAANGYAAVGMAEASQGSLADALSHYRHVVAELEQLVKLNPNDASDRRELMLAWGHVADTLGNPSLPNLGDRAGAFNGYQRIVAIAKSLYDGDRADQRAVTDYGITLTRLATVAPDSDPEVKLAADREAVKVLQEALQRAPGDLMIGIYAAIAHEQIGDTLRASGKLADARQQYKESIAFTEPMIPKGFSAALLVFLSSARREGETAAAEGSRADALSWAERALKAGMSPPPGSSPRLVLPRAIAAMGFTYAALARGPAKQPDDAKLAREWLGRTVQAWKTAQSDKAFGTPHVREMKQAEAALAYFNRP